MFEDVPGGVLVAVAFCVLMLGVGVGISATERFDKAEAISHHAAEWRIDPKTGEKSFHWLTDDGDKTE